MKGKKYQETVWFEDGPGYIPEGVTLQFKDKKTYEKFLQIEKDVCVVAQVRKP